MSDKAVVARLGDGFRDEWIVEFLRVIDFLPRGHAGDVNMADQVQVVAHYPRDVSVCNLNVIDVIHDFHSWRIHAAANVETPVDVIEDLVGALVRSDFGVRDFHAKSYPFLFGVGFHSAENRHGIVRAFLARHATAFARKSDQVWAADLNAHIDARMKRLFKTVVHFLPDQPVLKTRASATHQRWRQAVLPEDWHLLRRRKVHAFEADARQNPASLFEGKVCARPHRVHHALSDARSILCGGRHRSARNGFRDKRHRRHAQDEFSAVHAADYFTAVRFSQASRFLVVREDCFPELPAWDRRGGAKRRGGTSLRSKLFWIDTLFPFSASHTIRPEQENKEEYITEVFSYANHDFLDDACKSGIWCSGC